MPVTNSQQSLYPSGAYYLPFAKNESHTLGWRSFGREYSHKQTFHPTMERYYQAWGAKSLYEDISSWERVPHPREGIDVGHRTKPMPPPPKRRAAEDELVHPVASAKRTMKATNSNSTDNRSAYADVVVCDIKSFLLAILEKDSRVDEIVGPAIAQFRYDFTDLLVLYLLLLLL